MRLAAFIRANIEPISREWESFAATLLPEEQFSSSILRNHIAGMLTDIADNIDVKQTDAEQHTKSEGEPELAHYTDGAIGEHVVSRAAMGLSFRQFIAEFRVLRATVIRLWERENANVDGTSLEDMIRFNEAIDQMLTEGTVNYGNEVDRSRELFLSILGHDLKNPLSAIFGAAELLVRGKKPERHKFLSTQILVSAQRMSRLIDDLLELARVRLGSGIALHPEPMCLRRTCQEVAAEMQAAYPNRLFQTCGDNELLGEWDENKLSQVISNLAGNAVQHGAADMPITLTAKRTGLLAEISVHNQGAPIPANIMPNLFNSFYRLEEHAENGSNSLGLGLFIAKEIVTAHRGTLDVKSSVEEGTTFVVILPMRVAVTLPAEIATPHGHGLQQKLG